MICRKCGTDQAMTLAGWLVLGVCDRCDPGIHRAYWRANGMYSYRVERPKLFTEDGVETLRKIEANARRILKLAGAVKSSAVMAGPGDTWLQLASIDYLVERDVLREITSPGTFGQDRVFVAGFSEGS